MTNKMMARIGDRVIVDQLYTGTIIRIRYDSNNVEIYTVKLDDRNGVNVSPDGLYLARHNELSWL